MVGSSDAQAVGNFMRANNLTSDRIDVGGNYFVPDSTIAYGDATDLGQLALNQGNERIAAASRSETQRELNRSTAMSEGSGAAPVWNMRDASAALRAQSAPAVGTEEWFRTASDAQLHAAGYQTASTYDPAAARAADVRRDALLNYLNGQGTMALGGVISAGVMLGTNDVVAASVTTDAVAPLDSLLAPMGGSTATRLASGARTRAVPLGFSQQSEFVAFGGSLYAGLEGAGFKNAQAGFQGSSVTGRAFKSPYAPFDVGRISDYDIALSSPELFERAHAVGIGLRQQGTRTGPLMPEHLDRLGLTDLSSQLSQQAGRPVNFMIYRSIDDALGRSPTILVPRGPQ